MHDICLETGNKRNNQQANFYSSRKASIGFIFAIFIVCHDVVNKPIISTKIAEMAKIHQLISV